METERVGTTLSNFHPIESRESNLGEIGYRPRAKKPYVVQINLK